MWKFTLKFLLLYIDYKKCGEGGAADESNFCHPFDYDLMSVVYLQPDRQSRYEYDIIEWDWGEWPGLPDSDTTLHTPDTNISNFSFISNTHN